MVFMNLVHIVWLLLWAKSTFNYTFASIKISKDLLAVQAVKYPGQKEIQIYIQKWDKDHIEPNPMGIILFIHVYCELFRECIYLQFIEKNDVSLKWSSPVQTKNFTWKEERCWNQRERRTKNAYWLILFVWKTKAPIQWMKMKIKDGKRSPKSIEN